MGVKTIQFTKQKMQYDLMRRLGQRSLRLAVLPGGVVRVSAPYFCSQRLIEKFILSKEEWLIKKIAILKEVSPFKLKSNEDYEVHKSQALKLIQERVAFFNYHYRYTFKKITIRNQSTRWGSCSKRGNLNFNYRLSQVPLALCDYVIVHELCHLKEMNHSVRFWRLVAETIPDYKARQKELKKIGKSLF